MAKVLKNPHPGKILKDEFLMPFNLSQNALARAIDVPSKQINDLVRSITADTDLRLAQYFGLSDGYWLNLQNSYDILHVRRTSGHAIAQIKPVIAGSEIA